MAEITDVYKDLMLKTLKAPYFLKWETILIYSESRTASIIKLELQIFNDT
jgi:hypothetical protein